MIEAIFDVAVFDRGDFVFFGGVNFDQSAEIVVIIVVKIVPAVFAIVVAAIVVIAAALVVAGIVIVTVGNGAQCSLFLSMLSLFGKQGFAVFLGDLIVVRVDFAERQEPVPIAAKVDKCRLQRGFNPGYFGEIDVALDLLVVSRFKVKFLNPVAFEHRYPGFFRVARVDEHAHSHCVFSVRARRRRALCGRLHNWRCCVLNLGSAPG